MNEKIVQKYNEKLKYIKERIIFTNETINTKNNANIIRINILQNTDNELFRYYLE